jgi:hypothetical protein
VPFARESAGRTTSPGNPKVWGTAVDPGLGDGPAGDPVRVTLQVVDRLLDRTSAFRRLPGNKDRRLLRVNNVLLLAEERDRRQGGTSAIRCALREPADRT